MEGRGGTGGGGGHREGGGVSRISVVPYWCVCVWFVGGLAEVERWSQGAVTDGVGK